MENARARLMGLKIETDDHAVFPSPVRRNSVMGGTTSVDLGTGSLAATDGQLEAATVEQIMGREPEQEQHMGDAELAAVCLKLREAVALREKYRQPIEREPPGTSGPLKASLNAGEVRGWPFVAPPWAGEPGLRFELQRGVMVVWQERLPSPSP